MSSEQNARAKRFTSLHVAGNPILLTNCWDAVTARAIANLPKTQALATASYAVAAVAGYEDDDMPMDVNLTAVRAIAIVAREFDLPLSVDLQNGYGDKLEEAVAAVIREGVIGINLEDVDIENNRLFSIEESVKRVKRALKVAADAGVPDFHVNARSDALVYGGTPDDAIERSKAYLEAGAKSAFVWGGRARGGMSREEVAKVCKGVGGRMNFSLKIAPGNLTVKELCEIGAARLSIGPTLMFTALESINEAASKTLER